MTQQTQYLTPEGMKTLEARLKELTDERRPQVAERLRLAMEEGGDLSENAEYEDAKNEQAFVEGEIQRLETILRSAQIIEPAAKGKKESVILGAKVTVVEQGSKEKEVYHLVGSAEANPDAGKISVESPLGKAMLGAKVGDKVTVHAPAGEIIFLIKAIA
ncbi:MAG: transcription elongation factor GreA [Anaerolineae bacterium]|nr:transcription elongation factor GreA [Anaerolineae bacterium]NUQ03760.1 transcription elongation factor GreA [Anaerolineae bacterium]